MPKVFVVTGANRGLGWELSKQLLEDPKLAPVILYGTARDGQPLKLETTHPESRVITVKLDQAKPEDVAALAAQVKREQGQVDAVIVNGAIGESLGVSAADPKIALPLFAVNYHGALKVAQSFIPLMRQGGRIVVVSSARTQAVAFGKRIEERFFADDLTVPQLTELVGEYEHALPNVPEGWPSEENGADMPVYTISKVAVNTFVRILARDHPDITFLAPCPGAALTDMGIKGGITDYPGAKQPKDAARIFFAAAVGDVQGANGVFWANDTYWSLDTGKPQPNWYGMGVPVPGADV